MKENSNEKILSIDKNNLKYDDFVNEATKLISASEKNESSFIFMVTNYELNNGNMNHNDVFNLITKSIFNTFNTMFFSIAEKSQLFIFENLEDNELNDTIFAFTKKINENYVEGLSIRYGLCKYTKEVDSFDDLYHTAFDNLKTITVNKLKPKKDSPFFNRVNKLLSKIEAYDRSLCLHSYNITQIVKMIAKEYKLGRKETEKLIVASLLHDIGYVDIPIEIFRKKEPLTKKELNMIKSHPLIAHEKYLKNLPGFDEISNIILAHHEFIDGSGYPKGLKGDHIPIGSQMISIADTFLSMQMTIYSKDKDKVPFDEIVDYFIKNAGEKWQEELVTIFITILVDYEISHGFYN